MLEELFAFLRDKPRKHRDLFPDSDSKCDMRDCEEKITGVYQHPDYVDRYACDKHRNDYWH